MKETIHRPGDACLTFIILVCCPMVNKREEKGVCELTRRQVTNLILPWTMPAFPSLSLSVSRRCEFASSAFRNGAFPLPLPGFPFLFLFFLTCQFVDRQSGDSWSPPGPGAISITARTSPHRGQLVAPIRPLRTLWENSSSTEKRSTHYVSQTSLCVPCTACPDLTSLMGKPCVGERQDKVTKKCHAT